MRNFKTGLGLSSVGFLAPDISQRETDRRMDIANLVSKTITAHLKETLRAQVFLGGSLAASTETDFRRAPGRFTLPLSSPTSREAPGQSLRIKIPDIRLARKHMLWYLLFKGITVKEWFILSYLLELTLRGGQLGPCACFAGVLRLSSKTRKSSESWNSQLRPIHKILKAKIPQVEFEGSIEYESLLDLVLHELKVPQKALALSELYTVTRVEIPKVSPKAERYIGVGYKDKGNLPSGNRLEPEPTEEVWFPTLNARLEESLKVWAEISSDI